MPVAIGRSPGIKKISLRIGNLILQHPYCAVINKKQVKSDRTGFCSGSTSGPCRRRWDLPGTGAAAAWISSRLSPTASAVRQSSGLWRPLHQKYPLASPCRFRPSPEKPFDALGFCFYLGNMATYFVCSGLRFQKALPRQCLKLFIFTSSLFTFKDVDYYWPVKLNKYEF